MYETKEKLGLQQRYMCRKRKSAVKGDHKKSERRIEAKKRVEHEDYLSRDPSKTRSHNCSDLKGKHHC